MVTINRVMNEPVIRTGAANATTNKIYDLVYDPETGNFKQVESGTAQEGDTVTRLTKDGFASV